jgi:hypothetical protein
MSIPISEAPQPGELLRNLLAILAPPDPDSIGCAPPPARRDLDCAAAAEDAPALQWRAAIDEELETPLRAARTSVVARACDEVIGGSLCDGALPSRRLAA